MSRSKIACVCFAVLVYCMFGSNTSGRVLVCWCDWQFCRVVCMDWSGLEYKVYCCGMYFPGRLSF
jgi:hypothetical protein